MPTSICQNIDCIDYMRQLPDKHFDLAIVDPPYGLRESGAQTGGNGKLRKRILNQSEIDKWDIRPTQEYFDQLFRVSRNQIIWGSNYFNLPPTRGILVWDKMQPWPNFSQVELAWTSFSYPAKIFRYDNRTDRNDTDTDINRWREWESKQEFRSERQRTPDNSKDGENMVTPNPDDSRCHLRSSDRQERHLCDDSQRDTTKDKSEWNQRLDRTGEDGNVTNSSGAGRAGRSQQSNQRSSTSPERTSILGGVERPCGESTPPNAQSTGEPRQCLGRPRKVQSIRRDSQAIQAHWHNFPTQSPVCGRDDGIPRQLDAITFPRWREESIKAYGNAWVPQVAYQIFKIIEQYEKKNSRIDDAHICSSIGDARPYTDESCK